MVFQGQMRVRNVIRDISGRWRGTGGGTGIVMEGTSVIAPR